MKVLLYHKLNKKNLHQSSFLQEQIFQNFLSSKMWIKCSILALQKAILPTSSKLRLIKIYNYEQFNEEVELLLSVAASSNILFWF